jgi:hypothetical protein
MELPKIENMSRAIPGTENLGSEQQQLPESAPTGDSRDKQVERRQKSVPLAE